MSKVIYIIPGFTETVNLKGYQRAIKSFKSKDFKVVPIKITWKYNVMSDYIDEFFCQLSHKKSDEVYIFGFSFGAMIAFISTIKLKPKMLFLCSLSPYFKEDLKSLKKSWINMVGKKRIADLKRFSFQELAKNISCKTLLIAGEKESREVYVRVNDANKRIRNSELLIVAGAKHEISQKEYITKLNEVIFNL
ncbi:hypothetical protein COV13_01635 [Candidatus Woesearchaeota archaeon CG10_big_fil_rev_8_21_14_0_10_32_9]|nr:MAG: hypothetical protein COV13_01635 [Candidatus Woesearchaeota archaeon CG10_big_fil_rev_8_21_14_0_10_32_9]